MLLREAQTKETTVGGDKLTSSVGKYSLSLIRMALKPSRMLNTSCSSYQHQEGQQGEQGEQGEQEGEEKKEKNSKKEKNKKKEKRFILKARVQWSQNQKGNKHTQSTGNRTTVMRATTYALVVIVKKPSAPLFFRKLFLELAHSGPQLPELALQTHRNRGRKKERGGGRREGGRRRERGRRREGRKRTQSKGEEESAQFFSFFFFAAGWPFPFGRLAVPGFVHFLVSSTCMCKFVDRIANCLVNQT